MWTGSVRPPPPHTEVPGLSMARLRCVYPLTRGPYQLAPNYLRLFSFARVKERERGSAVYFSPLRFSELVPHHLCPVWAVSPVVSPAGPGPACATMGPCIIPTHAHTKSGNSQVKSNLATFPKTSNYTLNNLLFRFEAQLCGTNTNKHM